jgi:hypothetical protein
MMSPVATPSEIRALAADATRLEELQGEVRRALATRHLVEVASEIARWGGCDFGSLSLLGIPVDLLDCFPRWRDGFRVPFHAGTSGLRLAPSGAAVPLGTVRLQLSPTAGSIPYALSLLRDLLARLDPSTSFVVVVEPGADFDALNRLAARLHATATARVRFVPLRCISVFAQDNARAARDEAGRPVLLVPRGFRDGASRAEDALDPDEAARVFGVPVRRSRLYWEGGNVVHDEQRCFVGVDTIAENVARLGLSAGEVVALLEAEFGLPVAPLGRSDAARFDPDDPEGGRSGQASFHVDLDVALLGRFGSARRPRALVADVARGLDFAGDVLAARRVTAGHFLPPRDIRRHLRAEYEASAAQRLPLLLEYADTLGRCGYRVVGVPDLRVEPRMNVFGRVNLDFGYCNVLPGLHRGRPAVYHFVSGVARLDADAAARVRLAGVEPVAVSTPDVASALRLLQGALHCCCGSM